MSVLTEHIDLVRAHALDTEGELRLATEQVDLLQKKTTGLESQLSTAQETIESRGELLTAAQATIDSLRKQLADCQAGTPTPVAYTVKLGQPIQPAVDAARTAANKVVTLEPGTYVKQAVTVHADVTLEGFDKVRLDGQLGFKTGLYVSGVARGMVVTNYASDMASADGAVVVRQGGRLEGVSADWNAGLGIGIPKGSHGCKLFNVAGRHNGFGGISASAGTDDVFIDGLELTGNGRGHEMYATRAATDKHYMLIKEAGKPDRGALVMGYHGSKLSGLLRVVIKNVNIYANNNHGLWFDVDDREIEIDGGKIGAGKAVNGENPISLHLELMSGFGATTGVKGKRSVVRNIEFLPTPGVVLNIGESRNIEISDCLFPNFAEIRAMDGAAGGRLCRPRGDMTKPDIRILPGDIIFARNKFKGGVRVNEFSAGGSIRPSGTSVVLPAVKNQLALVFSGNVVV